MSIFNTSFFNSKSRLGAAMCFAVLLTTNHVSTVVATPQAIIASPNQAGVTPEVVAVDGQPFGVARIRYPVQPYNVGDAGSIGTDPVLSGPHARVLYPAFAEIISRVNRPRAEADRGGLRIGRGRLLERVVGIVREAVAETAEPQRVVGREVWFLFSGSEPLTLTIDDPRSAAGQTLRLSVVPQPSDLARRTFEGAMAGWWKVYTENASQRIKASDYPPLVERYLVGMLARRFELPIPDQLKATPDPERTSIIQVLQQVAGAEAMRGRALARVAQGDTEQFVDADQPLPAEPDWASAPIEQVTRDVRVEGLANRVPTSSFYIRFGSFKNYLWFRDLGNQHGGDITKMITLRGFDYQATKRIETQLNVEATELALLLGGTVVDDMAIIGHDLFLTEGASIGVLLKAKNAFLLSTSLRSERSSTVSRNPDAVLRDVTIAGKSVSFLSTPDNRIRSYMVTDGAYALISNSETLIEEFLETGKEGVSLASSDGFRYARSLMREDDDYKIFAYFSEAFFQNLVGPGYQIELRRRLNAIADIELIRLARLAAAAEGRNLTELEELIAGGFLPDGIGERPDGSGLILAGEQILDSRRGARGYFLPIADSDIQSVTAEEAAWYQKQADFYAAHWQEMDPVVAGIRSIESPNPGFDRLEVHAEVAPLVAQKYGWIAEQLGPPTTEMIRFGEDDIAAVQAYVVSDELGGSIPPHHLFVAVKDAMLPNPAELEGILDGYRALRSLSGYLGAWPQPGLLDRLPLGLGRGRPVGPGMTKLLVGLYRYQAAGFSLISFIPEVILASIPNLTVAESTEAAQVRFHIDSLQGTQIERWVNQQLYQRSFQASVAGAQLLRALTNQLKVSPDQAKETARHLLDARLQCPLGGEYVFGVFGDAQLPPANQTGLDGQQPVGGGVAGAGLKSVWRSTAWTELDSQLGSMPADFEAPLLKWFRGASGRMTQYESRLVADLILDMQNGL